MALSPRFQKLAAEVKTHIREISPAEAEERRKQGATLIDVRETDEFQKSHAVGATHLSRGVLEMKIEAAAPELDAEIVCYCGGGNRSALAAESLQRMGYRRVASMTGGFKSWQESGLPTTS